MMIELKTREGVEIASEEDISSVAELWVAMTNDLTPQRNPRVDWWCLIAEELLDSGDYTIFVYRVGGKIVGFVDAFMMREPSAGEIHGIVQYFYVLPEYRMTHAGKKLYKAVINHIKEEQGDLIQFMCPSGDSRKWARRNYKQVYLTMQRRL